MTNNLLLPPPSLSRGLFIAPRSKDRGQGKDKRAWLQQAKLASQQVMATKEEKTFIFVSCLSVACMGFLVLTSVSLKCGFFPLPLCFLLSCILVEQTFSSYFTLHPPNPHRSPSLLWPSFLFFGFPSFFFLVFNYESDKQLQRKQRNRQKEFNRECSLATTCFLMVFFLIGEKYTKRASHDASCSRISRV